MSRHDGTAGLDTSSLSRFYIRNLIDTWYPSPSPAVEAVRRMVLALRNSYGIPSDWMMSEEEWNDMRHRAQERMLQEMWGIPMSAVIPNAHQETANKIWAALIEACDAYFLRGETQWAGDSRAPEFTDKQIKDQFNKWSDYSLDSGAMHWHENGTKEFHFDFNSLPDGWKRAVCERVWVICKEAKLDEDVNYQQSLETFLKDYHP